MMQNAGYTASAHNVIAKFSYTMIGVLISILIIYLGLLIYNKTISKDDNLYLKEENLQTPKTKEDAIMLFIGKNKI